MEEVDTFTRTSFYYSVTAFTIHVHVLGDVRQQYTSILGA